MHIQLASGSPACASCQIGKIACAHALGTFSPPPQVSDPDMHHGTCRDACRDREIAVSSEVGGGGKRSRHSRRMRNLQFYLSGKRPMNMEVLSQIFFPKKLFLVH